MAEPVRFERTEARTDPNGFQDRRNKPLCQGSILEIGTGIAPALTVLQTVALLLSHPINMSPSLQRIHEIVDRWGVHVVEDR